MCFWCGAPRSGRRLDAQQRAIGLRTMRLELRADVQIAIWSLLHVAHADTQGGEERFPTFRLSRLLERHAHQRFAVQRADEHASLPPLEAIARIEDEARRADRRHPEHARTVHARSEPWLIGHL